MNNETKKSYEAPDLTVYGGVAQLTQTGGGSGSSMSNMSNMSNMSRMSFKPVKTKKSGGR